MSPTKMLAARKTPPRVIPNPPPNLTKELKGIWNGWGNLGDREVCREAAAKGTHVNLAIQFLSARINQNFDNTKIRFTTEVKKWSVELLERKQIFRALHILTNIKLDPYQEFCDIFCKTANNELRDYIGNHLKRIGKLDKPNYQLWEFLTIIIKNSNEIDNKLETNTIECLKNQNDSWKAEIATILFLKTDDTNLIPFLNPETLWQQLLKQNNVQLIRKWINICYNGDYNDCDTHKNLIEQFRRFSINTDMLNSLNDQENIDVILNEFSKFGIFRKIDTTNLLIILKRLVNSYSLNRIDVIFNQQKATIKLNDFLKLIINFCLEHELFIELNWLLKDNPILESNSKYLTVINDCRKLVKTFNKSNLRQNIFNVSRLLADTPLDYFDKNPIILLFLLILTEKTNILDLIEGKSRLIIDDIELNLNSLQQLNIFTIIANNSINNTLKSTNLTVYNLLDKHLKVDSSGMFEFRFKNVEIPRFSDEYLSKTYGYTKKLNYKFYLKYCRPSKALKLLSNEQNDLKSIEKKTIKLAIHNFNCDQIIASCVCFLEMLQINSLKLRCLVQIGRILLKSGRDTLFIIDVLSTNDRYSLLDVVEDTIIKEIDFNQIHLNFVKSLQIYEITIQYCRLNSLKLPEKFLKVLAGLNLWLPFFIFIQIYNYPLEQVKLLLQFFKSPTIAEHLTHSIINDIRVEDKNILIKERDSRSYYLSKIGVRKSLESGTVINRGNENLSISSVSSDDSSIASDFEIDISNLKATLVQTLIRCHNSTDPPKALLQACQLYRSPTLAIFATCYEPDSLITSWLTWLAVSCELCQVFTNYETIALSPNSVSNLLVDCMKNCYLRTVYESLLIFLPENPLRYFVEILVLLTKFESNRLLLIDKLDNFQSILNKLRKTNIITDNDNEMNYLTNRIWLETISTRLLSTIIDNQCRSINEQTIIVEILFNLKIWKYFTIYLPNFTVLSKILNVLLDNDIIIKLEIDLIFDEKTYRQAIINCINSLLDHHCYQTALNIAKIEKLPPDLILIKQWQYNFDNRTIDDYNFWQLCDETLRKYEVTADCVIDFYFDYSDKITNLYERYFVLKLAVDWARRYDLTYQYELEMKMWMAFLNLDEKDRNFNQLKIESKSYLYGDLIRILKNLPEFEDDLNPEFLKILDRLIVHVLNCGDFWQALRLQKYFKCKSSDLLTLKLLHSLAENILTPAELNSEQRLLISSLYGVRANTRRTLLSRQPSSLSSSSQSPRNSSFTQTIDVSNDFATNDTLVMLKLLVEHLHSGIEIGQNIFMMYRISNNIDVAYSIILSTNDYKRMLKDSLDDNCLNKLDVVHDFFAVFKTPKDEIADFICEELINSLNDCSKYGNLSMWDVILDQNFHNILQLLQDNCSLLGHKVYAYAKTLHQSQNESNIGIKIDLIIELIIRAHDCFTADCNMEGISLILKQSRNLITHLLKLQKWQLMVRLLTGVARYTEMTYIFHILMKNEQFEYLLRKGSCKDNAYKIALLDYLKRYCPENKEIFKIVALHFMLFSEVAILWENEAQNLINNLITIAKLEMQNNKLNPDQELFVLFQNTEATKTSLKKAMENYTHATEFHLQGEKLNKANDSAKQAELIALQLSLFNNIPSKSTAVCILNLTELQICTLITESLNVEQILLLTGAYNYRIDWSTILYKRYIMKNQLDFFENYLRHCQLNETIVSDIARKFINDDENTFNETRRMKQLLSCLKSVYTKYKIASELGFSGIIEDLISTGKLFYLKDTVWKSGYRN